MDDKAISVFYLQIIVAIASLICSAALMRKALSFQSRYWRSALVFILALISLTYISVTLPLYFMSGTQQVIEYLVIDLMMYGGTSLVLIGIFGFVMDHLYERPMWLVIAAAAILSVGLGTFYFTIRQERLLNRFEIQLVDAPTTESISEPVVIPQAIQP